ncbi:hypothetical protein Trydic_g22990 [Trypoxylus dichotomus]
MNKTQNLIEETESQIHHNLEDEVVQDILKTGTDLRQYSRQIEKELKEVENKSIQDYIKESQNIARLHGQISACDQILERMESMLLGFQNDLGSISSEILSLQRKSISMSQELSNRQAIRGQLSQFIDDMAVPESLIMGIMDCPVTDKDFVSHLQVLNHKISFVKEQSFKEYKSCLDVKDILEKLKIKAMTKIRTIMKLQYEECTTKEDLMGIEDTANRGLFHKSSLKHKGTVFTIGNRGDVLAQQLEAPIIVPHTQSKNRYYYEALFRSEQYALVDNACREYLFVSEFFMVRGQPALNLFNQIMGKTLQLLTKNLETFVAECYDTIALFLCFHLILRYQLMCHKRCVPALDKYWEALQSIILPRFEQIFRMNINSIRDCDPTKFNRELGPHYITRRYAEFSAALVGISENFPNELVNRLLAELQEEVELFILRMAGIFPQRKEQLIYLINNYDMILNIIMERTRDNSKEAESFRARLSTKSAEYAEEILSPHFGEIMQFVKECEHLNEKSQTEELKKYESSSWTSVATTRRTAPELVTSVTVLKQFSRDDQVNAAIFTQLVSQDQVVNVDLYVGLKNTGKLSK